MRFILLLLLLCSSCSQGVSYQVGEKRVPVITAKDLNGKEVTLPADLPGERTLLLIAFKREQQGDIDTWTKALEGTAIQWREIPVIPNYGSVFRSVVDNGMRSGIKTLQSRGQVITLFTDPKVFRQALGLEGGEQIYAVAVNRSGEVLKVASGAFTQEAFDELRPFLLAEGNSLVQTPFNSDAGQPVRYRIFEVMPPSL